MARARKCDICKAYYDEYNHDRYTDNPNGLQFLHIESNDDNTAYGKLDLCPSCIDAVKNFIKERANGELPFRELNENYMKQFNHSFQG